jgi:hypothetical protein
MAFGGALFLVSRVRCSGLYFVFTGVGAVYYLPLLVDNHRTCICIQIKFQQALRTYHYYHLCGSVPLRRLKRLVRGGSVVLL